MVKNQVNLANNGIPSALNLEQQGIDLPDFKTCRICWQGFIN